MQAGHVGLSLTAPRAVATAPPVNDTIVLDRDVWIWGASTAGGKVDGTQVTFMQDLALQIDPSAVQGTENDVGGSTLEKHTLGNGRMTHNRGLGGQGPTSIRTRTQNDVPVQVGASDICFNHIGDNTGTDTGNVGSGVANTVNTIATAMGLMLTACGARPSLAMTNTRGSFASSARASISETPGSFWFNAKETLFRRYTTSAGQGKVIDCFQTLMDEAVDYGLIDPTNDQADVDKGVSPMGFMTTDGSHMNQHGIRCVTRASILRVVDAILGGVPFALRQYVTAAQPATPAAGDVIGTPFIWGSGGTMSLAPSNTQTDYAVSASGQISRVGATPPARDLTPVHMQFAKTGRTSRVQKRILVGERAAAGVSKLVEFDGYCCVNQAVSKMPDTLQALTIVGRLQGATGGDGASQIVFSASTGGIVITRNVNNALDIIIRNTSGQTLFSMTSASNLFRVGDAPRWFMASVDIVNGLAKLTHFLTPSTGVTSLTNGASANTQLLSSTSQTLRLSNPHGFGNAGNGLTLAQLGTKRGSFRLGDFWMGRGYFDPTVQANRELFVESDGSPKASLVASTDVAGSTVSGASPLLHAKGNATDWRLCNFIMDTDNEFGFSAWKNPNTSVPGYLVTV
ncbi:MAG: hypothetical protein JNK30_07135 [Phenylobacterium sp.]|uniref:hypothetical protein n=1 Tax=Phenylobacterium sp. TaxID=1871053 RepID=UPI001A3D45A4|nr:hypothetical protein [Phenylobacterium sp.]MBL8771142.1 hypothetical protein [Phenylobacterium sp.]